MDNRFQHKKYLVRKKLIKLFGDAFRVYDTAGNVILFSKLKAFKLKEDIRVFSGEDEQEELLCIKARNMLDFSATYDVIDSKTKTLLGSFERKGFRSFLRDTWLVLAPNGTEVGTITEDSMAMALIRRILLHLIPQTFVCSLHGTVVCTYTRRFNPLILKTEIDFSTDANNAFDKRLGICGAILLSAIEGRQE